MKKLLLIIALLVGGLYVHSMVVLSEDALMRWVSAHHVRELTGNAAACDDFAEDARVSITSAESGGLLNVEGGKRDVCEHMRKMALMNTLLKGRAQTDYLNVSIERGGFLWLTARVRFTQQTSIRLIGQAELVTRTDKRLEIKRELSGAMHITRLQEDSRIE